MKKLAIFRIIFHDVIHQNGEHIMRFEGAGFSIQLGNLRISFNRIAIFRFVTLAVNQDYTLYSKGGKDGRFGQ